MRPTERICGLVGVAFDRIAVVLSDERHDAFLYVVFCCTMADVRMNMENPYGGKWKVSSCDMAGVVGKNRVLSGFWECSTNLIVLLNVDDYNLAVLAMPLYGGGGGNLCPTHFSWLRNMDVPVDAKQSGVGVS